MGEIAGLVSAGDLSREIVLETGDATSVMAAKKRMVETIRSLVADANMLGDATTRMDKTCVSFLREVKIRKSFSRRACALP